MKEEFLHFIWKYKLFNFNHIKTTAGDNVVIKNGGTLNTNAGPDFLDASIQIGSIDWSGNIEIHIKSSDWTKHKHQYNDAFNNVILHVVWQEDKQIISKNKQVIPCIELKDRINPELVGKYENLLNNKSWIACEKSIDKIDIEKLKLWLNPLAIERLEVKSKAIFNDLNRSNYHWEQAFYNSLSNSFGLKVNAEAFSLLSESIPIELLKKYSSNLFQLESLLFGQAGLLFDRYKDEYPRLLLKEYEFLKHKHELKPISKNFWKFARLRPANFPTLRIAQLSQVIHTHPSLFNKVITLPVKEILNLFTGLKGSDYWDEHYRFDSSSTMREKHICTDRIYLIMINTVCPILYCYGKSKDDQKYIDKATDILENLPGENNSITRKWSEVGFDSVNALESQALIHLKKNRCDKFRCLDCQVGYHILARPAIMK